MKPKKSPCPERIRWVSLEFWTLIESGITMTQLVIIDPYFAPPFRSNADIICISKILFTQDESMSMTRIVIIFYPICQSGE